MTRLRGHPLMSPLVTVKVHELLLKALRAHEPEVQCSLDLDRSNVVVTVKDDCWEWQGHAFPYLDKCKDRTIYYWDGTAFTPLSRYSTALIKLVPTDWGAPT